MKVLVNRRARFVASAAIVATIFFVLPVLCPTEALGQEDINIASDVRIATFFSIFRKKPDNYTRLLYVRNRSASTDARLRNVLDQMLATELAIFGRPRDADALFPRDQMRRAEAPLPDASTYTAIKAVDYIVQAAKDRRVVMVNEAHYRPQTRLLTLALLPKLHAMGYTHFAVEGLDAADTKLTERGYPIEASGFYLNEPVYAEIIREALRLHYVVIAYEPPDAGRLLSQDRETEQARNLQQILQKDPKARMFVHAGYAHIDKDSGQLPMGVRPMAAELIRLSGIVPLSVDQTILYHGDIYDPESPYSKLQTAFSPRQASIFISRIDQRAWSLRPAYHDATVLLPDTATTQTRPLWLSLDGRRHPYSVDTKPCRKRFPCLLEARYADENDEAVPADQLVLLSQDDAHVPLYLAPGRYRLRIRDADGAIVRTRVFQVTQVPRLPIQAVASRMPDFMPTRTSAA